MTNLAPSRPELLESDFMLRTTLLLLTATALAAVDPPGVRFPVSAGVHDVKVEYGAKGDGISDDTAAFQAAFKANSNGHMKTVYVPAGTYLVSDLVWFEHWMFLQGEHRDRTIIKLKDNAAGFQDPAKPKAVLGTTNPTPSDNCRNMEFSVHVLDLTVDTGRGNPGANGIEFLSNNGGGLENVVVRSGDGQGVFGIDMTRLGPGPALCRRIEIKGFNYGIATSGNAFCSTFEDIRVSGQKLAGWLNEDHPVAIRRLVSENTVPALRCTGPSKQRKGSPPAVGGQFVLIEGSLSGGAKNASAIVLDAGSIYLRDVNVAGYGKTVSSKGRTLAPGKIEEFSSEAWDSPAHGSLRLPILETPSLPWEDPSTWVNVMDFKPERLTKTTRKPTDLMWTKPIEGFDATLALQQAIDSGATTVYLPQGNYLIRSTIHLRGKLKVLQGCGSIIIVDRASMAEAPLFRVDGEGSDPLFVDRFSAGGTDGGKDGGAFEHASTRPLVILHSRWAGVRTVAPKQGSLGPLFVDDMCGSPWRFEVPQQVFMRQLNDEGKGPKIRNRAADLWILGFKTEAVSTNLEHAGPQARSEILGGFSFPAIWPPEGPAFQQPMYDVTLGRFSTVQCLEWANEVLVKASGASLTAKPGHKRWLLWSSGP